MFHSAAKIFTGGRKSRKAVAGGRRKERQEIGKKRLKQDEDVGMTDEDLSGDGKEEMKSKDGD